MLIYCSPDFLGEWIVILIVREMLCVGGLVGLSTIGWDVIALSAELPATLPWRLVTIVSWQK